MRKAQQQILQLTKDHEVLNKAYAQKESELNETKKELRSSKDALIAANLRSRRSQIIHLSPTSMPSSSDMDDGMKVSKSPVNVATGRRGRKVETTWTKAGSPIRMIERTKSVRENIVCILQKYDPAKARRIDEILEKFNGRESVLLEKVSAKYEGDSFSLNWETSSVVPSTSTVVASPRSRTDLAIERHKERMRKSLDIKKNQLR